MQNFKKSVLGLAVVSALIGLTACGGGGSASSTASTQSATATGRFVDAAVQGLNYVTSSGVSGVTDANGTYFYKQGDTVTFSVGGIQLPTVTATGLVTPLSFDLNQRLNSNVVLNIARFLQALDADGDPNTNGIVLDTSKLAAGAAQPKFDDGNLDLSTLVAPGVTVPSEAKASSHLANTVASENGAPKVTKLTTITPAVGSEGIAEILAFHKATNTMFYTVDIAQTPNSFRQAALNGTVLGDVNVANDVNDANFTAGGVQSLDVTGNLLAIAVQANSKTDPGVIAFYRLDTNTSAPSHTFLKKVTVGALPDGVAFSPDGSKLVVANEAEPDVGVTVDPEGSISIIDIANNTPADNALTLGFTDFNASGSRASELPSGYRKALQGATVAQDIEPEFVAITDDSSKAIVTLQENNALAIVSLTGTPSILSIVSAGYSDYANNELAPSDRATDLNGSPRVSAPALIGLANLFGTRMPDGIAAFNVGGTDYVIYANEGDDRDDFLPGNEETARIKEITLDSTAFPNATALQADEQFGRLNVLAKTGNGGANGLFGDTDQDGTYEKLYMLGSRSFTIQSLSNPGADVFDSKSELELTLYGEIEALFDRKAANANVSSPEALLQKAMFGAVNGRLDNKGPEPESVAVGSINNKLYAFIGLERTSTVAMYDISNPVAPVFVDHIYNLTTDANGALAGDISPEALKFVSASDSPTGKPLLLVGHEVSGTVSVYEFN